MIVIEDDMKKRLSLEFGLTDTEQRLYEFMKARSLSIMIAQNTIHKEEAFIQEKSERMEAQMMDTDLSPVKPVLSAQQPSEGSVPIQGEVARYGTLGASTGVISDTVDPIEAPLPPIQDEVNEKAYFNSSPEVEKKDMETQLQNYNNMDLDM